VELLTKLQVANYAEVIPYLDEEKWTDFFLKDAESWFTTKTLFHYLMDMKGLSVEKIIMSEHFGQQFVELWYDHAGDGKNFSRTSPNDVMRDMTRIDAPEELKREWLHMYLNLFRNYACTVVRDSYREEIYELTRQISELHDCVKYYENKMSGKPY
jgi:hypothetical protein